MLKRFISNVKYYINNKNKNIFNFHYKDNQKIIGQINKLLFQIPGDYWLLWYRSYLVKYNTNLKINSFFPIKHSRAAKYAIDKLTIDNVITIKDIKLPYNFFIEASTYINAIFDSLSTYIFENLADEEIFSLLKCTSEGPYEYHAVKISPEDIVIDAGSCAGEFSALAGLKASKVYAFEPIQDIIDNLLSKTAVLNPNITICPYALSDKKQNLSLNINLKSYNVEAIDLDTFVKENKLPRVDFIKVDIEGAERYMLKGATGVLKEFAPKIAICTYHLPDDPQILRELILDANSNYVIEERFKKMYAYVPK